LGAQIICDKVGNSKSVTVIRLAMIHNLFVMSVAMKMWIIHYEAGNTIQSMSAISFKNILLHSHTQAQMQSTVQEELLICDAEHAWFAA
jgi:hypothetical protein